MKLHGYLVCALGVLIASALAPFGCENRDGAPPYRSAAPDHPNILFIVWDTVRADRLSLYGHHRPTTPFLEKWAKNARVYDNCIAVSSTTVPSHASMFTGLMPCEHGTSNEPGTHILSDEHETLAELLKSAGYDTYAFVCNPYLVPATQDSTSLMQGFDLVECPWDAAHQADAIQITFSKVMPYDRSNVLSQRIRGGHRLRSHDIKACGELALPGMLRWLEKRDSQRPYFAFMNFMEAHAPLLPPVRHRQRFMTPEQVGASYQVDRSFPTVWRYIFGYHEYTSEEMELTGLTYDAALYELDEILEQLITTLESAGLLKNTLVVLVGDHGEHLGEHRRLDHQYSVYEGLLRVPLVIYDPPRYPPGRESRPVTIVDLFPSLLERVGLQSPIATKGVNLLHPPERRVRLGEYLTPMSAAFDSILDHDPHFDPRPWMRTLRAFYNEPYKLIAASDDRHELYDIIRDPGETADLTAAQPEVAQRLLSELAEYLATLKIRSEQETSKPAILTPEQRRLLERLGYLNTSSDDEHDHVSEPSRP